jgi:hypothetical protein
VQQVLHGTTFLWNNTSQAISAHSGDNVVLARNLPGAHPVQTVRTHFWDKIAASLQGNKVVTHGVDCRHICSTVRGIQMDQSA